MNDRLSRSQSLLMVVDMQEKLLPHIEDHARVEGRAGVLVRAMGVLGVPVVWTEQYPKGLGVTAAPIAAAIGEAYGEAARPMEKIAFGCLGDAAIAQAVDRFKGAGRDQLLLCGIETHVCILQTALAALDRGWQVFLAEDASGSRRAADRAIAHKRLIHAGVIPVSVEMAIMEALGRAGGEAFKAILPLLKSE